jgi:hypothetical protein
MKPIAAETLNGVAVSASPRMPPATAIGIRRRRGAGAGDAAHLPHPDAAGGDDLRRRRRRPAARRLLESITAMPSSAMKPIAAETLNGVAVSASPRMPPATALARLSVTVPLAVGLIAILLFMNFNSIVDTLLAL